MKGCWWVSSNELMKCSAMKNNHCTVCTGKCHYSKHVKENKKYETKTEAVTMTFDKLQEEYERPGEKPEMSFDKKNI